MRALQVAIGLALALGGAALWSPPPAAAGCSVYSRHPCAPTTCSVFRRGPCLPDYLPPLGENLQLTVLSRPDEHDERHGERHGERPKHELDTLRELFAALRSCWVPPPADEGRNGTQISVRFSLRRNGEIIDKPRVTYVTRDTPDEVRKGYRDAVNAALDRCTPMPLTEGLGGAIAGRPIAIRFIDDRR